MIKNYKKSNMDMIASHIRPIAPFITPSTYEPDVQKDLGPKFFHSKEEALMDYYQYCVDHGLDDSLSLDLYEDPL